MEEFTKEEKEFAEKQWAAEVVHAKTDDEGVFFDPRTIVYINKKLQELKNQVKESEGVCELHEEVMKMAVSNHMKNLNRISILEQKIKDLTNKYSIMCPICNGKGEVNVPAPEGMPEGGWTRTCTECKGDGRFWVLGVKDIQVGIKKCYDVTVTSNHTYEDGVFCTGIILALARVQNGEPLDDLVSKNKPSNDFDSRGILEKDKTV